MKKLALLGIAVLALGTLTFASRPISAVADQTQAPPQDTPPPANPPQDTPPANPPQQGGGHVGMMKQLAEALNLTDAQKAQIKPIVKIAHAKIKTIQADATLTKRAKHQQVKAVNDQMWKDIEALLTPDQITKLKDFRAKLREQQKQNHSKNG